MNAIDARKTAEAKVTSTFQKQLDEVMDRIKIYATAGKFELKNHEQLKNDVQECLELAGYKVEYKQCGINEYETVISW